MPREKTSVRKVAEILRLSLKEGRSNFGTTGLLKSLMMDLRLYPSVSVIASIIFDF